MEEIAISKFKATCLAVLERVRTTGRAIRVTRFGQPVADIVPPNLVIGKVPRFGTLANLIEIHGDIVSPVGNESDWEAAQGKLDPDEQ